MKNRVNNRVFGAVLVRATVANYNADFTGSPRTLPNGIVYATDKALKYAIRNYLKLDNNNKIFYTTRYKKENMQPLDIDETYIQLFGSYPSINEIKKKPKEKDDKYFPRIKEEIDKFIQKKEGYTVVQSINNNYLLKKEVDDKISFFVIIGHNLMTLKEFQFYKTYLKL